MQIHTVQLIPWLKVPLVVHVALQLAMGDCDSAEIGAIKRRTHLI